MQKSDEKYAYVLHLPTELQEKFLSFLSYDEIAKVRLVCKSFNVVCMARLNKGFSSVEKFHACCLRNVKAQLPRRESERRNHALARHCDILNSIETRLSLLSMTFVKYVELKLCCFIPGKVIDEIYRVLRIIQNTKHAPRAHEILQELRDISSMAMEHFDEKIVPILKQKMMSNTLAHLNLSPSVLTRMQTDSAGVVRSGPRDSRDLQLELTKMQLTYRANNASIASIKKELADKKAKALDSEKKIQDQEKAILELNHLVADQNAKILEQEGRINELNRTFLDYERRFAYLEVERSRRRRGPDYLAASHIAEEESGAERVAKKWPCTGPPTKTSKEARPNVLTGPVTRCRKRLLETAAPTSEPKRNASRQPVRTSIRLLNQS